MKLHEIIKDNEDPNTTILIEKMIPLKQELLDYYTEHFTSEPILMVTDVMNATQYGKIVPAGEFGEAVYAYMDVSCVVEDDSEEGFDADEFAQYETICANSIMLKDL